MWISDVQLMRIMGTTPDAELTRFWLYIHRLSSLARAFVLNSMTFEPLWNANIIWSRPSTA